MFRRRRKVLLVEHTHFSDPERRWGASVGSASGEATMAEGPTPEAAVEALRIRVQAASRKADHVEVDW